MDPRELLYIASNALMDAVSGSPEQTYVAQAALRDIIRHPQATDRQVEVALELMESANLLQKVATAA